MQQLQRLKNDLHKLADLKKATNLQWFFKTGSGEYGEGDKFLGIKVPEQRKIARKYITISYAELASLIKSPLHEERLTTLLILIFKYQKADIKEKRKIYKFYFKNINYVSNWDLVDLSAPQIVGHYVFNIAKEKDILQKLAVAKNIWLRRIAIISTQYFIRQNEFNDTLLLAKMLLKDKEDLIHKAVGWMLREIGKRNLDMEIGFLNKYYQRMPRVMLRYAIEKFAPAKRQAYLKGKI